MANKNHPLYMTWKMMRQRCNNPRFHKYPRYGGRGIKVCDRWNTFTNFAEDMGSRPAPGYTLNRVNNDGNYTPENCNWASSVEQANNRCRRIDARLMTYNGVTRHQAEWGKLLGIGDTTLNRRRELGWSDEEILTTPVDKRFNKMKVG